MSLTCTTLRPMRNVFYVREVNEEYKGGIMLPDKCNPDGTITKKGEVVWAGENDVDIKEGDVIFFSKYAELETTINGEKLLMVNYSDEVDNIVAKIEKDSTRISS